MFSIRTQHNKSGLILLILHYIFNDHAVPPTAAPMFLFSFLVTVYIKVDLYIFLFIFRYMFYMVIYTCTYIIIFLNNLYLYIDFFIPSPSCTFVYFLYCLFVLFCFLT